MTRKPRIAIAPEVQRALRSWAAREGKAPDALLDEVIRAALPPEVAEFAKLGGARSQRPLEPHAPQAREASESLAPRAPEAPKLTDSESTDPSQSDPLDEKRPKGPRPWHGGPPPYEERHPEIAARVLAMWAGGSKKGGMSREAVAKALQADGIPMTSGTVSKITIRARQKINRTVPKGM